MDSRLSFPGRGVQPPDSRLGDVAGFGWDYLTTAPWIMRGAAVLITLTTLSVPLTGDRLDPTIR